MASGSDLHIDPDGVRAAGATVATAASTAAVRRIAVRPSAADVTSVSVASELSALVAELITATANANNTAAAAAARLAANARNYTEQETVNAAALRSGATAQSTTVPVNDSAAVPLMSPAQAGWQGPGATPVTGKGIAALIHQGPGPAGLDSAAALLDSHAASLDGAATEIRAGRSTAEGSWGSAAAERAGGHLRALEVSYTEYAGQARALSADARAQAENFRRARSAIPSPPVFDDLERRLQAANAANSAPGSQGRYTAMVTKLQTELSVANQQAVQGFNTYSNGAQLHAGHLSAPSAAPGDTTEGAERGRPGVAGTDRDEAGSGDGADALNAAPGAASEAPNELLQAVLPAVLGAVAGAAGGLLGALSGVGEKLQQTGGQLAGGLLQGAGEAMSATSALQAQNASGLDPAVDGFAGDGLDASDVGAGGGGSVPGDTEPASAPAGPLASAPASAAAAPAAAPPTFSSAVPSPTVAASSGGGMPMGAMLPPPMMGLGRGGQSSDDDRRLYPEKRLHLPTPPNSEPVKGRREARETRSGAEE
ncbi:PPE domain-containing protein [Mycolicibacterium septicum]|uniref:PPE domain-containing protein n=1 Tax=Mycolicibacterium septicum TaxID=98668 RepID=UPI002362B1EC|nr:PPE domain-containing protein [Mycolicibacterium septicum]